MRWTLPLLPALVCGAALSAAPPSVDPAPATQPTVAAGRIDWQPWAEASFERSRTEQKPVFLFMSTPWTRANLWAEEKILSDPGVVAILNERWIPILVNRDRRPDIDLRYQVAVNAVRAGETGWPLMAMLIDTGELITGGSSYALEDRMGQPGLRSQLRGIAEAYPRLREAAAGNREVVTRAFLREKASLRAPTISFALVEEIGHSILESANKAYGGLGAAPRLPTPFAIELAGTLFQRTGNAAWLETIESALRGMERGAIFDRVGGGFHRSTLDEAWRLPEYEKLLTYNATILQNYLVAWEATRDDGYRLPAERTVDYILRELTDPGGGFYVGQAAASRAEDPKGTYYAWGYEEFFSLVPQDLAALARAHFNVTETGELAIGPPPRSLLYLAAPREDTASRLKIDLAALKAGEARIIDALARARAAKPGPPVDRAIYVDSCAAGALAMLDAARVLDRKDAREAGLGALDRLLGAIPASGPMRHRVLPAPDPEVDPPLALDHLMMARALIAGYELAGDQRYLDGAREVVQRAVALFWDPAEGGFFDVAEEPSPKGYLSIRRRLQNDIAYPSLPSIAARVLQRLALHVDDPALLEKAAVCLMGHIKSVRALDYRQSGIGLAVESHLRPPTRYVVVARAGESRGDQLAEAAARVFDPGRVIVRLDPRAHEAKVSALPGRKPGGPFLIACSGSRCSEPVTRPEDVNARLVR